MAFVKDAVLDGFKRDVELNFNALEERVIELEKLLKQYNGGVTVDAVVPEPTPEPEPVQEEPVEEEDVTDEYGQPLSEEEDKKEDSSPKSKSKKKK